MIAGHVAMNISVDIRAWLYYKNRQELKCSGERQGQSLSFPAIRQTQFGEKRWQNSF